MRVFISADIEGVAGISSWDEARKSHPDYGEFRRQMTAEVRAACEGAQAAGAQAITVKDAHGSARNLLAAELPQPAQLIRGWSGHPFAMVQGLDSNHAAVLFIGFHARAGAGGNPLSHTMSSAKLQRVDLNGVPASEYLLYAYAAATIGVPVVFVSGDETLCREVRETSPATHTFATKWGEGASQHSLHPQDAVDGIRTGVTHALRERATVAPLPLPASFVLDIQYKEHSNAYYRSFYPGAERLAPNVVRFTTDEYFDVLRALSFLI
jgi:D-amino peptidase